MGIKELIEAKYWESIDNGKVRCNLCYRRCIIGKDGTGVCGVRKNVNGKLYTLVYGKLTSANIDPIEKKPLFHFNPGAGVLSISTVGCNFKCRFCCNWVISQIRNIVGRSTTPDEVVDWAIRYGANGISYTYNEPTVFYEFMLDTAKIAKKHGLFNTMVTNGYITPEALKELAPYMDAVTVDFKGSGNIDFYRKFMGVPDPTPIYQTLIEMKRYGIFIEITDLIVPEVGDSMEDLRKLVKWIIENLGDETPFHVLRFHPDYQMIDYPPTPVSTLERAAKIALEEGLKYVYIGNVPGHRLEHTYCPECKALLVRRFGFEILEWNLTENMTCPKCGSKINIKGRRHYGRNIWASLI